MLGVGCGAVTLCTRNAQPIAGTNMYPDPSLNVAALQCFDVRQCGSAGRPGVKVANSASTIASTFATRSAFGALGTPVQSRTSGWPSNVIFAPTMIEYECALSRLLNSIVPLYPWPYP